MVLRLNLSALCLQIPTYKELDSLRLGCRFLTRIECITVILRKGTISRGGFFWRATGWSWRSTIQMHEFFKVNILGVQKRVICFWNHSQRRSNTQWLLLLFPTALATWSVSVQSSVLKASRICISKFSMICFAPGCPRAKSWKNLRSTAAISENSVAVKVGHRVW